MIDQLQTPLKFTVPWGPVLEILPERPASADIAGEKCEGGVETVRIPSGTFSRECFRYGKYRFYRSTLTNTGSDPVEPKELISFQTGPFDWDGVPDTEWKVYAPKRTSNELGHVWKIAELPDRLAIYDSGLVQDSHADYGDPFLLFSNGRQVLLIGILDNDHLLAEVQVKRRFDHLYWIRAVSLCNSRRLPAGESLSSVLTVVFLADHAEQAITEYVELLKKYRHLPAVRRTPFVVSSWHYYGVEVSEKTVEQELEAIQKRKIPADVYEIDGGWYDWMGDWNADPVRFPHGMKYIADKIRAAGLIPGLWFGGFQAARESKVMKEHPEWILRHADGSPVEMNCSQRCYVLDLSVPAVLEHLTKVFHKYAHEYGFKYIKVDFTRRVFASPDAVTADPTWDLLKLWNAGFRTIRQAIGDDAYLLNCGGHPSAGLDYVDSLKGGCDSYACWKLYNNETTRYVLETYTARFWETLLFHPCGTALNFRLCEKVWENVKTGHKYLRLGRFTDTECRTVAAAAFTHGGIVQTGDPLMELPEYRMQMQSKVIPSIDRGSMRLNLWDDKDGLLFFRKDVSGKAGSWKVLTLLNFLDTPEHYPFDLAGAAVKELPAQKYAVIDMDGFKLEGVYPAGARFDTGSIAPHGSRVLLVFPLPEKDDEPFFIASDVHYSGGADQVEKIELAGKSLKVTLSSRWHKPVALLGGIRENGKYRFNTIEVQCAGNSVTGELDF